MSDSQDGFCPIHDTYLDDGYCVACLVGRVGDLERRAAALTEVANAARHFIATDSCFVDETQIHYRLPCAWCDAWDALHAALLALDRQTLAAAPGPG